MIWNNRGVGRNCLRYLDSCENKSVLALMISHNSAKSNEFAIFFTAFCFCLVHRALGSSLPRKMLL